MQAGTHRLTSKRPGKTGAKSHGGRLRLQVRAGAVQAAGQAGKRAAAGAALLSAAQHVVRRLCHYAHRFSSAKD